MIDIKFPKVLLLGNGINRAFEGDSWENLIASINQNKKIPDVEKLTSPMPLQAILVTEDNLDVILKNKQTEMFGKIKDNNQRATLNDILTMGFDHILTTNYSYELELAGLNAESVNEKQIIKTQKVNISDGINKAEPKYLLHTYNQLTVNGVSNNIWHIHGEARKLSSMVIGHYYYCNLLQKCKMLADKRKYGINREIKSWIDAFILGDIYVLGFGFGLSEIDLWWLVNRKKREKTDVGKIYFYDKSDGKTYDEKKDLLRILGVEVINIDIEDYKDYYKAALEDISKRMNSKEDK